MRCCKILLPSGQRRITEGSQGKPWASMAFQALQFGHLQGLPTALDRGYSGSGRGSLNHGGVADHIGWRAPTCLNLFAQKCHRVLTGRAPGGVAPLWE